MSLPILITVNAEIVDSSGPVAGRIVWSRSTALYPASTSDDDLAIPEEVVTIVGADGIVSQPLYACNDPAASPTGFTWEVRPQFPHWRTPFNIVVPYDAVDAEVNLNQLAPVPDDGTGDLYALANHTHEGGGGGEGPAPASTVVSETAYGASSSAGNAVTYSRGNHTHGTPALPTAADVGAATAGHNHSGTYDPAGTASGLVSAHEADTTAVHGIANTANLIVEGDARLTNSRAPTAHASTHADGGADEISIDGSQVTGGTVPIARIPTGTSGTTVALGNAAAGLITTHEAAANPHPQYVEIRYWDGDSYEIANSASIYVGPSDPGAVADGSIWIDTDA